MITRIELTNFMSHEQTVIEPAPGLTVLVGPNNCGKSAVVAALQILCHNDSSTYVLRHGERECSVKVETHDGHCIEWRRKNAPSYVIDGRVFDRLGRGSVPEELHQVLRLAKVDAGDDADFDVHFGTQKSPVFLIGSSAAHAARFFASSSDAIRLVQMQKRHKDKLQEAQREKNRLEAESRLLNAELSTLEPVVDLDRQLKDLQEAHRQLVLQRAATAALTSALDALVLQARVVAQHTAEAEAMSDLAPPGAPLPTAELAELISELEDAKAQATDATAIAQAVTPLASPPAMHDTALLETLCSEIGRLNHEMGANAARQRVLEPLASPPQLPDTAELASFVQRLKAAARAVQAAEARTRTLHTVTCPPVIADELTLAALVHSLTTAEIQVQRYQQQILALSAVKPLPASVDTTPLNSIISHLDAAAIDFHACAENFEAAEAVRREAETALRKAAVGSVCPVCGGLLDADRLLISVAAGCGDDHHG